MPSRRLLILDDDVDVARTIENVAASAAFDTHVCTNPDEFLELAQSWSPTHLAVDLIMPQRDGLEVLAQLAQRECTAKILITSGVGARVLDAARRSAVEHGLNIIGALSKPFSGATLRRLLEQPSAEPAAGAAPALKPAVSAAQLSSSDLERALEEGEIFVMYQPKIECRSGRLAGFEVLARWQHPQLGLVPPARFIPLAEHHGLIDRLTDTVLQLSLGWLSSVAAHPNMAVARSLSTISLAINVSAHTLHDLTFFDRLTRRCNAHAIEPARFILELTETSAMEDPTSSLALLTRARMKGFNLSIDDFGTGYSSMLQLVRLPFSEVKVDQSFVMAALKSDESRAVVKSIIDLAHSLGLRAVAEGVEDAATLDFLTELQCDLVQGYFTGRPMRGDEVLHWMEERLGPAI